MRWTHPAVLWLVPPAVALVLVAGRMRERRLRKLLAVWHARPAPGRERWSSSLVAPAVVLVGVALAGPWARGVPLRHSTQVGKETLVLVLDLSLSMTTRDVAPDRAGVARRVALQLATSPRVGRVGIVAFAGDAYLVLPPTSDPGLVSLYLDALDADAISGRGSNLARAVAIAVHALAPPGAAEGARHPSGVAVVLSDGEGFQPDDSLAAAETRARRAGVVFCTVAVGTIAGGDVPGIAGAHSRAHPEVLAHLSRTTGGLAVAAGDPGAVRRVETALTRSTDPGRRSSPGHGGTAAAWLAALAALLLATERIIGRRPVAAPLP